MSSLSAEQCFEGVFLMKTWTPKPDDIKPDWYVVDADDKILGRLATKIATRLRGKHKPEFAPHMDMGDFVVVVNAEKIKVTGRKLDQKRYYRYSGYVGGLKETDLRTMLERKPTEVIRHAVRGMLPKNRLGRKMIKKLKIYAGPDHPHSAQQPKSLEP
jgi:large subunit ribosomal protein L13